MKGSGIFAGLTGSNYFYFDANWETYRGRNWIYSVNVLKEYNTFQHLFGIDPDCYNAYTSLYHPEFAARWINPICNSHNEVLSALINVGILGLIRGLSLSQVRNQDTVKEKL